MNHMFRGYRNLVKTFSLFSNLALMYNMTTFDESIRLRIRSF